MTTRWRTGIGRFGRTLQRMAEDFFEHGIATQGAALAFFTLFSLAPVLLVIIFVAGLVWGQDAVQGQVVREFAGLMGREAAETIQHVLRNVATEKASGLASAIGIVTLLSGASGVFVQLQGALNAVWGVAPRPGHVFRTLLRKRLLSFALLLAAGFLLVVSLAFSAALSALREYFEAHSSIPVGFLHAADVCVSYLLIAILLGLIYRILPDAEVEWRDVVLGAVITALLIVVGKWAIGEYLGRSAVATPYGAAGSVVLILLWIYYASLIVLIGAEFTHAHTLEFHEAERPPSPGASRAERAAAVAPRKGVKSSPGGVRAGPQASGARRRPNGADRREDQPRVT
ncbi:MAG TPA: YihY/virulence factor BrkB family protein [Thermoanaerobaculia bacterium]|nr:YihY/virulence factor BrkB family protein [Thermoanaerobaculia bacterium]